MKTISLSRILIPPNRQRQDFSDAGLIELAASIRSIGLLSPIILRPDERTLVAGERRLRAIRDFIFALGFPYSHQGTRFPPGPESFVPYVTTGELDPIALEEAELDENLKRVDLSWQERASAISRLHTLRCRRDESHRVSDTAEEVTGRRDGAYHDSIRRSLIVAEHLGVKEVADAKSVDEAFKILRKREDGRRNAALAEEIGRSFSSSSHTARQVDCLDWMAMEGNEETFDVILTDPPYGMGADEFGDGAGKLLGIEHSYKDDEKNWESLMERWCPLSYLVAKPQAHAYVFCDVDHFLELRYMMQEAGWYVFRTPLIHYKPDSGRVPLPEHGPRRQYELILYAIKGKKPVNAIYSDVISSRADEQMGHGAQKPVEVYRNLLARSARPGDHVLDSFAGSGTIFPAAHELKVFATGLEKEAESYGKCLERLRRL